jgi:hypothetical protein
MRTTPEDTMNRLMPAGRPVRSMHRDNGLYREPAGSYKASEPGRTTQTLASRPLVAAQPHAD